MFGFKIKINENSKRLNVENAHSTNNQIHNINATIVPDVFKILRVKISINTIWFQLKRAKINPFKYYHFSQSANIRYIISIYI